LWEQALIIEIAASLGKRILLRSQQLGPFTEQEDIARITSILEAACYISTRDFKQSSREVASLPCKAVVVDQVDDAFILQTNAADEETVMSRYSLDERGYICVGYRDNRSVGIEESCFEKTARLVESAYKKFNLPAVFLAQGPFDLSGLQKLAGMCIVPSKIINPEDGFRDAIAIASRAALMIAAPHHSLIFALRGGVPILSPVMGAYYFFKNTGSMRFFGLQDDVIDLTEWGSRVPDNILSRIHSIYTQYETLHAELLVRGESLRAQSLMQDRQFALHLLGNH